MSQPHRGDPQEAIRKIVDDLSRTFELDADFGPSVNYVLEHYAMGKSLGVGRTAANTAVAKLRKDVDSGKGVTIQSAQLMFAIYDEARSLAGLPEREPLGVPPPDLVQQSVVSVRNRVRAVKGRPGKDLLQRHVLALVALIQEATGQQIHAAKEKNSVYEPHLSGVPSEALRAIVHLMEPGTTDTQLSYWIRGARKDRAGKPMRVEGYLPGYRYRHCRIIPHHRDNPERPQFEVFSI